MNIAIFDTVYDSYHTNKGTIPTVVLIGRDENKKKRMYRQTIYPYVMIEDYKLRRIDPLTLKSFGVKSKEYSSKRSILKRPTVRLNLKNNNKIDNLAKFLWKVHRTRLLESDLAKKSRLALRYLVDNNIRSGFKLLNGEPIPVDLVCPLRVWLLDIEVLSTLINSVNPYRDEPINMITWYDNYLDMYFTLHTHELDFKPLLDNHIVIKCSTEEQLISLLVKKYLDDEQDPDLVSAHALKRYDLVKLIERMKANDISPKLLSPEPFRNVDMRRVEGTEIKGRIFFDMLYAYLHFTNKELASYSLENIIEVEEIDVPKVKFMSTIKDLWEDKACIKYPELDLEIPIKYADLPLKIRKLISIDVSVHFRPSYIIFIRNVLDVMALKAYSDKRELIEFFDGMRRDIGCLFNEIFMPNRIIDTALLRMCRKSTALPSGKIGVKGGGFKGGLVLEPEPGIYYDTAITDASRQYPRIIRGFNISPEMIVLKPPNVSVEDFVKKHKKKNNFVVFYKDVAYAFKSKRKGIIPRLVDKFWKQRDVYTKLRSEAIERDDEVATKTWNTAVDRTKAYLNALFGVMGFTPFRLFKNECSAAITLIARLGTTKTIELLKERGYKVIYGDTDSVFFEKKPNESVEDLVIMIEELNKELGDYAMKTFNLKTSPFSFSLEKVCTDIIILTKKHYCNKSIWSSKSGYKEEFDYKGLEVVRSDSSSLEREVMKQILVLMLNRSTVEEVQEYWSTIVSKLDNKEYTLVEVGYPAKIGKALENNIPYGYTSTTPSHIKASCYSNMYLSTDWRTGDKPRRIPIDYRLMIKDKKTKEPIDPKYPIMFSIKGKPKEFRINGIAIDEYYQIPKLFQNAVDWKKITKRLTGKVDKLFNFMKEDKDKKEEEKKQPKLEDFARKDN